MAKSKVPSAAALISCAVAEVKLPAVKATIRQSKVIAAAARQFVTGTENRAVFIKHGATAKRQACQYLAALAIETHARRAGRKR